MWAGKARTQSLSSTASATPADLFIPLAARRVVKRKYGAQSRRLAQARISGEFGYQVPSPMLSPRATSVLAVGLLGLVTAAGMVLRLEGAGHSLWLDELHTAWCVAGQPDQIAP